MPDTLHPPAAQSLRFSPRAVARSESANYHQGEDIRLHLVVRGHQGHPCLIANDCLEGRWGEELRLPLSPEEALSPAVQVAFTAMGIELALAGAAPVAFRPGLPVPQSLVTRHGPDIEAQIGAVPAARALAASPMAGEGVIEAAASLPGTGYRLLLLRLADPALEESLILAPVPLRLRDATGLAPAAPAWICALPEGQGLLAAVESAGDAPVSGAELLPPGRAPVLLVPAHGQAQAMRPPASEFLARLAQARGPAKAELGRLLARGFTGRNTLSWLSAPVGMSVARLLPTPEGLLLQGWLSDPGNAIAAIRLRAGEKTWPLRPGAWLDTEAWDGDGGRGFLAHAPFTTQQGTTRLGEAWLDVTLATGETGTLPLPLPEPLGIAPLRATLAELGALPEALLDHAFGAVLGPALAAWQQQRLARPMAVEERVFGAPPEAPRASIIIPLHGRLDMLPVQMALFSACRMAGDEIIFVLDDPPRREAALAQAQSAWERFGLPLRLILPAESRGFGPASNLGLRHACGGVVVFLNADAFPQATDWLDLLVAALAEPSVGAAGARLLYPDGSLQHGGMRLEPGPAGWLFPAHPGKGLRPLPAAAEPRDVEALTGACLALRREVAEQFGGFDPAYVIGDFEDADLCARLLQAGLRCVMEDRATLVHLERQSQGRADAEAGRWNLTLLNAWTYNRHWKPA
ncbi:glycosyltransferase [Sediminicoccus sp. KRV36]|uniref:glycosyltransferase n=1 Tax=Sediminicoccus sp. KRV36 TaxID=3133721 RepID=UPI00200FAF6D|nr:glycosyltransferase [Sediminicoccus rosea]UPY37168.1 glycosyltransferase [Sediminicoccus rosea]